LLIKEAGESLRPESWSTDVRDVRAAIAISTHLLRVSIIRWVLVPVLVVPVLTCLSLIVCDAIGVIKPMRPGLLGAVAAIIGSGIISSAVSDWIRLAIQGRRLGHRLRLSIPAAGNAYRHNPGTSDYKWPTCDALNSAAGHLYLEQNHVNATVGRTIFGRAPRGPRGIRYRCARLSITPRF